MCYGITSNFCGYLICVVFCGHDVESQTCLLAFLHILICTWLFKTDAWRFIKYVHSITCNMYTCLHDADPHCKHFLWLKILNLSSYLIHVCTAWDRWIVSENLSYRHYWNLSFTLLGKNWIDRRMATWSSGSWCRWWPSTVTVNGEKHNIRVSTSISYYGFPPWSAITT